MRYLNKIIFINSANISYAEISVDGNVHFTGTQGVGKSTVLRALLFFYNADKQKLGIQQGQKSFDEFYFKQSNSYILYEVVHEHGAYTVLVSRYQGRATFRFIDAPYNRNWIIDEHNDVQSDWVKIREQIDKNISVSARIESGSLYRDIIFGNTNEGKYAKYAIVESRRYQNIPRSIQNVFLNSKLDADFVKSTIIQSMSDEELPVDLATYRRQVDQFEREYAEIDCWYRKDRNGEVPVMKQAMRVSELGRTLMAYEQQMFDIWHFLNYAVAQSEERIPVLKNKADEALAQKRHEKEHLQELSEEYNKEKDSLNQQLGVPTAKLKEIVEKRKYFENNNISEKLVLAELEPSLKQNLSEKNTMLNSLLSTNQSIAEKYNIARTKLQNELTAFGNAQNETLNLKRNEVQMKRQEADNVARKQRAKLDADYLSLRNESDARLAELYAQQHSCASALKELRTWHPLQAEMEALREEMKQLQIDEKEFASQLNAAKILLQQKQLEGAAAQQELTQRYDKDCRINDEKTAEHKARYDEYDSMLSRYQGSFYEWLNANVPDWEDNIGRVVDEQRVLYAQGLQPSLSKEDGSANLFGVNINFDAVEDTHRSPDEYRKLKKEEAERLDLLKRERLQIETDFEKEQEKLKKKLSDELSPIRQQITALNIKNEQIPVRRRDIETRQHALQQQEQERIDAEREVRTRNYNEATLKVESERKAREQQETKRAKAMKELDAYVDGVVKPLAAELNALKADLEREKDEHQEEFNRQKADLDVQEKLELQGKGVDTLLLEKYKNEIKEIENSLHLIEEQRNLVAEYRYVERELFAKESAFRSEKKQLEARIEQLKQRYNDKKQRIELRLTKAAEILQVLEAEIKEREDGLNQYRLMTVNENLVPANMLEDTQRKTTKQDVKTLISELRGIFNDKRMALDSLKNAVTAFNRNFKPQNAFGFNTTPSSENDFIDISINLQEFLDNNKIEDYRQRTSEHYKDILGRISSEIGSLMKRRAEVDAIINDINRDFIEKNFAGVIRSIELRTEESSDRMMRLLNNIREYCSENELEIGELNLFSGDNHDAVNAKVVDYLKSLSAQLQNEPGRTNVTLSDTFRLQFRVKENDNDTGWVERINNVGSDGTDILVKAMVNIMLINVFKKKAALRKSDFIVHCMMDEIGRLHPNNIRGILQFANTRNIYLINSSPTSYNAYDYKYTYMLSKNNYKTSVARLLKKN